MRQGNSARTMSATATRSLPTVNGFDEFLRKSFIILNAEEEPELPDYPKDPAYKAKFGPRGVLKCTATDRDDPDGSIRAPARVGKADHRRYRCADQRSAWRTIDDETSTAAIDFMKRQTGGGQAVSFCWFQWHAACHLRTHVSRRSTVGRYNARRQRVCRRHAGA